MVDWYILLRDITHAIGQLSSNTLAGPLVRQALLEKELSSFLIYPSVLMLVIPSVSSGTMNRFWIIILLLAVCLEVGEL